MRFLMLRLMLFSALVTSVCLSLRKPDGGTRALFRMIVLRFKEGDGAFRFFQLLNVRWSNGLDMWCHHPFHVLIDKVR